MDITTSDVALLRLLQLSSASLPVGGYAFSQGLEYAIDGGWLKKPSEINDWLRVQLFHSLARVDIPVLIRLLSALRNRDFQTVFYWNQTVLACRESRELLLTDTAMGEALIKLLRQLQATESWEQDYSEAGIDQPQSVSFITAFAIAANHWTVTDAAAVLGLLWSWLENQVAAATKLLPLGQTQAQQLLSDLQGYLPDALELAKTLSDDELGSSLPALAIASAKHETQYSRLFRS